MSYNQGDVVLLPFPFTNQQGSKVRPGIVVSNSLVNNKSTDVIIVQLTTQNPNNRILTTEISNIHVSIPFKPPHDIQYVYCKKVLVMDSQLIIKTITAVQDISKLEEVLKMIQTIFNLERQIF